VTASTLLLYITAFLSSQVLLGIAYGLLRSRVPAVDGVIKDGRQQPLQQPAAWSGLRTFRVARRVYEDAAQTQCSFYLEPLDGQALPDFKPGQFLTFSLLLAAGPGAVARTVTRCYSLSDCPTPAHYRVTIKRVVAPIEPAGVPEGAASNFFHDHVHAGQTLQVRAPSGHFHLDTLAHTPVVLIAGGIGITPMMSMLRWCAQHQPERVVHLYYGVRNSAEHAYKAVLEDMARTLPQLRLHVVNSKPLAEDTPDADYQHPGRVDLALLKQTLPHGVHAFYICGPAALMESLVPELLQWGVARTDIHFEAFGPASVRLPDEGPVVQGANAAEPLAVHFQRSGRTLSWSGKQSNLLDFAEAHGIQVESGCRSGSCGSCVSTVVRGTVDYASPPDFELAPGQCLLCVGRPREALALDA
jgi:ferredoxin-NADP reductase